MGYHKLDIYYSDQLNLPSHFHGVEIDAEDSEVNSPVALQGEGHAVVEIETDEECTYYFSASDAARDRSYVLQITAADAPPKGVSSEFERLLLLNAVSGARQYVSARPEVRPSRRVNLRATY